jgi:hypothetical protein
MSAFLSGYLEAEAIRSTTDSLPVIKLTKNQCSLQNSR